MHSATSAVRWHLNPEDGLSHPWLRNAMSIISAAKWVIKTRVGLPIFVVWHVPGVSLNWAKGSRCMPFTIPMVWREPTDHVSDCYFCLTSISGVTVKSKHTLQYPHLPYAMRPVPHSAELPVPKCPINMTLSDSESNDEDVGQDNNWSNFCTSLFFQLTTPLTQGGPEWYRPRFEPVKESSWTFSLQVKGLESSAPRH